MAQITYARSYFGRREELTEDRIPERLRKAAQEWADGMRPGATLTLYAAENCLGGCGSIQREAYSNPTFIAVVSLPARAEPRKPSETEAR